QRVDRERRPGPIELEPGGAEAGAPFERELEHAEAMVRRRQGGRILVRRGGGGHEPDLVEVLALAHLLGGAQVPEMHRVEGAAENADAAGRGHSRIWPFPRTR